MTPTSQLPSTLRLPSQARTPEAGAAGAQLLDRIRGEYLEMPGLKLTLAQAQRLWHLRERECEELLGALIDAKFLCRKSDGQYARVIDLEGIGRHSRVAKAELGLRVHRTTRKAAS